MPMIVKGHTNGEEYRGQVIRCLASELYVSGGKVHVSEIIHIVTVDVVDKAPAHWFYTAKEPVSVLLEKY